VNHRAPAAGCDRRFPDPRLDALIMDHFSINRSAVSSASFVQRQKLAARYSHRSSRTAADAPPRTNRAGAQRPVQRVVLVCRRSEPCLCLLSQGTMAGVTTPSDFPSAPVPALRIGNQERTAAIRCLDEHLSAGRLDADEYADRITTASLARTRGDIEPLFLDLPVPHPFQPATIALPWQDPDVIGEPRWRWSTLNDWSRAVLAGIVALLISIILGLTTVAVAVAVHEFGSAGSVGPYQHQAPRVPGGDSGR
jgi:hypothetical protein